MKLRNYIITICCLIIPILLFSANNMILTNETPNSSLLIDEPLNSGSSDLLYSTLMGDIANEYGTTIVIGVDGCVYIAGYTDSLNFPTSPNAINKTFNGGVMDGFVCKFGPGGFSLIYSTYIGGDGNDYIQDIVVDSDGNAYITGQTFNSGTDYPTTIGANDTTHNGNYDGFVSKIDKWGLTLEKSTFIGGSGNDICMAIALDNSGDIYVGGYTDSNTDLPTTPNVLGESYNGGSQDGFIAKLSADFATLEYCSYIGGDNFDQIESLCIDSDKSIYITGYTTDATTDYPTTINAYQTEHAGNNDGFVSKINFDCTILEYSTLIGAASFEQGSSIVVDSEGYVYITGSTNSDSFPTTETAFNTTHGGLYDAFVAKIGINGESLEFSTFLGGANNDYGVSISLDSLNSVIICGKSSSQDYETTDNAYNTKNTGASDVVISKISSDGEDLIYSSYIGGTGNEDCFDIAIDQEDNAFLIGQAQDHLLIDYPTTPGAYNTTFNGNLDIFISKIFLIKGAPLPTNIITSTQTIEESILNLQWTYVEGADYYRIYINGTLNSTTTFQQQILLLSQEGNYSITVTAVRNNFESELSTPIIITVDFPDPVDPDYIERAEAIRNIIIGSASAFGVGACFSVIIRKRNGKGRKE